MAQGGASLSGGAGAALVQGGPRSAAPTAATTTTGINDMSALDRGLEEAQALLNRQRHARREFGNSSSGDPAAGPSSSSSDTRSLRDQLASSLTSLEKFGSNLNFTSALASAASTPTGTVRAVDGSSGGRDYNSSSSGPHRLGGYVSARGALEQWLESGSNVASPAQGSMASQATVYTSRGGAAVEGSAANVVSEFLPLHNTYASTRADPIKMTTESPSHTRQRGSMIQGGDSLANSLQSSAQGAPWYHSQREPSYSNGDPYSQQNYQSPQVSAPPPAYSSVVGGQQPYYRYPAMPNGQPSGGVAGPQHYVPSAGPPVFGSSNWPPAFESAPEHRASPPSYQEVVSGSSGRHPRLGYDDASSYNTNYPRSFGNRKQAHRHLDDYGDNDDSFRNSTSSREIPTTYRNRSLIPGLGKEPRRLHRRAKHDPRDEFFDDFDDHARPARLGDDDDGTHGGGEERGHRERERRRDVRVSPFKTRNIDLPSMDSFKPVDPTAKNRLVSLAQQLEEENAALESKLSALRRQGQGAVVPPLAGAMFPSSTDNNLVYPIGLENPSPAQHSGEQESDILRAKRRIEEIMSKQIDISRLPVKSDANGRRGVRSGTNEHNTSFWGIGSSTSASEEDKYLSDLLAMQKEMDYLRQKAALSELKDEIEAQTVQRKAERELQDWLTDKKHKMQTLRVKKALALEQLRFEEEMEALGVNVAKIEAGIEKPTPSNAKVSPAIESNEPAPKVASALATETSALFEFSVDGLLIPAGAPLEGTLMRVVCAFVDSVDGATIGRMVASNWQPVPKNGSAQSDIANSFSALGPPRRGPTPQSRPTTSSRPTGPVGAQPAIVPLSPFPLSRRITEREAELFKLSMRLPSNQLPGIMGAPKFCSHLRIMAEVQVKDGEAGASRASGWCTLDPSKAMSAQQEQQADASNPGDAAASADSLPPRQAQFGSWRSELRLGVADSSFAPEARLRTARSVSDADTSAIVSMWLLFRLNRLEIENKEPNPVSSILSSLDGAAALDKVLKSYPRYTLSDIFKEIKASSNPMNPQEQPAPPASSRPPTSQPPPREEVKQKLEPVPEAAESKDSLDLSSQVSAFNAAKQLANRVQRGAKLDAGGIDELRTRLWQRGTPVGPASTKYQREAGIDLYIDAAMNLPDNVTVSRVVVKILTSEMDLVPINRAQSVVTGVANCMGDAFSPNYNLKVECRAPVFNCTCTVLVRIDCLDASTLQTCGVGYAAIELFCSKNRELLRAPSDPGAHINTGSFQLPIHGGIVPRTTTGFCRTTLSNNPKLPCASILVRIVEAPKSSDGLATLSCSDVPDTSWAALGLKIPAPAYASGVYDGVACEPTQDDIICFAARQTNSRGSPGASTSSVQSVVSRVLSSNSSHSYPPLPDGLGVTEQVIQNWVESLLGGADAVGALLDYSFAVPYSPETGMWLNVLSLHNVPDSGMFSSRVMLYKVCAFCVLESISIYCDASALFIVNVYRLFFH